MTITVGIPTCWGGQSLVETVKSMRRAVGGGKVTIMVEADRTPIARSIKKQLENLGVKLHWNTVEGSQFKKIKQMIDRTESEIFISTQDDITFDSEILSAVQSAFASNSHLTMVGARVLPLPSDTLIESALAVMIRLIDRVSGRWNSGKNYLAASGRFLAFRTNHFNKFNLPPTVVNGDMFMYLENKRLGGKFAQLHGGKVYIRPPQRIKDQIGPSSRFQFSREELMRYFHFDISKEYHLPKFLFFTSFLKEFVDNPISAAMYCIVFLYSRIEKQPSHKVTNPVWTVDASTKNINRSSL